MTDYKTPTGFDDTDHTFSDAKHEAAHKATPLLEAWSKVAKGIRHARGEKKGANSVGNTS